MKMIAKMMLAVLVGLGAAATAGCSHKQASPAVNPGSATAPDGGTRGMESTHTPPADQPPPN